MSEKAKGKDAEVSAEEQERLEQERMLREPAAREPLEKDEQLDRAGIERPKRGSRSKS